MSLPPVPTFLARALAMAAVVALGLLYVYFPTIFNGMDRVSGDIADARIGMSIFEHWKDVFTFSSSPLDTDFFYPFSSPIAYGEVLLLGGVIYTPWRLLGLDPLLAFEFTNWTVRALGAVGVTWFAMRFFRIGFWWALAAAFLFLIVTGLTARMMHHQNLFVAFVPFGFIFFDSVFKQASATTLDSAATRRLALSVAGFTLFIGAWALTHFYSMYTFALLLIVYFAALNALSREVRSATGFILRHRFPFVLIGLGGLGLAGAALLGVYLPALGNEHSVESVRGYAGSVFSFVNVGANNALWSPLLGPVYERFAGEPMVESETATGYTLILALTFLTALAWIVGQYGRNRNEESATPLALAIACVFVLALAVRVGDFALWEPFFLYLPGAEAIRVPGRFQLFVAPLVITLAFLALSRGFGSERQTAVLPLSVLLVGLIVLEQHRIGKPLSLNRPEEVAFLNSIPDPPETCRAFFVFNPRLGQTGNAGFDRFYSHSVDAMIIAQVKEIPTVNGMGSFQPIGWNLEDPFAGDYLTRVETYAAVHGISEGLCGLDLERRSWQDTAALDRLEREEQERLRSPATAFAGPQAPIRLGDTIDLRLRETDPYLGAGWSHLETIGRWINGVRGEVAFRLDAAPTEDVTLAVTAFGFLPGRRPTVTADVFVDSTRVGDILIDAPGNQVRTLTIPAALLADREARVVILNRDVLSPQDAGVSGDPRKLGIGVMTLTVGEAR